MNIYEKLNEARLRFQNANIKQSGDNKFANYKYYDLSDILPTINKICVELKMTCLLSFGTECATLDIVNAEKIDEKITFLSPMSEAQLRGCHAVQNLGAVITYITRYLYIMAFAIVEHDALDAIMNPNDKQTTKSALKSNDNKEIQNMVNAIKQAFMQGVITDDKQIKEAESYIERADIKGITMVYNYLTGEKK